MKLPHLSRASSTQLRGAFYITDPLSIRHRTASSPRVFRLAIVGHRRGRLQAKDGIERRSQALMRYLRNITKPRHLQYSLSTLLLRTIQPQRPIQPFYNFLSTAALSLLFPMRHKPTEYKLGLNTQLHGS